MPKHVPQYGLNLKLDGYGRNPYHATCPVCGAAPGEYCHQVSTIDDPVEVEGVGPVPHGERRDAAHVESECAECLDLYGPTRSATTVEDQRRKEEERKREDEARMAWIAAGGKPWEYRPS